MELKSLDVYGVELTRKAVLPSGGRVVRVEAPGFMYYDTTTTKPGLRRLDKQTTPYSDITKKALLDSKE